MTPPNTTGERSEEHGIRLRDQAVANVDSRHGYTIEFATDPDDHRAEYDEEQERLERDEPCGFCAGEGLVYPIVESEAGDGRSAEGIMLCPDCQGVGTVPPPPPHKQTSA